MNCTIFGAKISCDERQKVFLAFLAFLGLVTFLGYFRAITAPPLLDEQFVLNWLTNACSRQDGSLVVLRKFLLWGGPDVMDTWGTLTPLSLTFCHWVFGGSIIFHRLAGITLHWLASGMLYVLVRSLYREKTPTLALASALLFALYPLNAEAVSWLGGRACQLSTVFFLACLYFYPRTRCLDRDSADCSSSPVQGLNLSKLGISLFFFVLSLASSTNMWVGVLVLAVVEATSFMYKPSSQLARQSVACLAPFVVCTIIWLVGGQWLGFIPVLSLHMTANQSAVWHTLKSILFPINEAIWHGYSREYRFLCFLVAPIVPLLVVACTKDRGCRQITGLATAWLFVSLLPISNLAVANSSLYGSRALYFSAVPFCLLMALALLSLPKLINQLRWLTYSASMVLLMLVVVFYFRHLWKQNSAYKVQGKILKSVQDSMGMVVAKEQLPFLLVRDIPQFVALVPSYKTAGMPGFDGRTHLLAFGSPPGGRLKDALRQGKFRTASLRWDKDFHSLVTLDLSPQQNEWGTRFYGQSLIEKLRPGLMFLPTVSFDEGKQALVLESNSRAGPALGLNSEGLSPLEGNFFYVDAMINTPGQPEHPQIELHWLTRLHSDYDNKERRTCATATVNDGQFHRYFLPLRTIGWTTNGPLVQLMLGFPAGAKVWLKEVGVDSATSRIPSWEIEQSQELTLATSSSDSPFYNYPTVPELGLGEASDTQKTLVFKYCLANVSQAVSGLIEISKPNQYFANPNGSEIGEEPLRTDVVKLLAGTYEFNLADLPGAGVYSLRIIALDAQGKFVGNFSDAVHCLVSKR